MFEIKKITKRSRSYSALLKEVEGSPSHLFARGNLDLLNAKYPIAVVGTRKCSSYGTDVTSQIVKNLAYEGTCIVSGLAYGIDAVAHNSALENNIPTIAVLGGSIDDKSIYPSRHRGLAKRILDERGLIISEYEIGSSTYPSNFLARNRIIAGISLGTLVVEAPLRSGALATARYSLEENRSVYAIPGSITSILSKGTNNLIKQGAFCVTSENDILDDIGIQKQEQAKKDDILTKEEKTVLQIIEKSPSPIHIDSLIEQSSIDTQAIASIILSLVLKDFIKEVEQNTYNSSL